MSGVARCIALLVALFVLGVPAEAQEANSPRPGLGVDAYGRGVIDPTDNVRALNEAANKRQDDLRQASDAFQNARLEALKALMTAELRRVDEQSALRAEFADKLSIAEAKRIDAIRAVDVNAVTVASQRASDQASVLATQVASSAEALRTLVATTASANATNLQQLIAPIVTRLTTIEQAQYEGKGKQSFSDPALLQVLSEVKLLREGNSQNTGKTEGISASWGIFMGVAGLLIALFAIGMTVIRARSGNG